MESSSVFLSSPVRLHRAYTKANGPQLITIIRLSVMAAPFTLLFPLFCSRIHSFIFKNVQELEESKNQKPDKFRMMQVHASVYVFSAGVAIRTNFVLIAKKNAMDLSNCWSWNEIA